MATRNPTPADEPRALATIEAIYGGPDDVDDDPPIDPAAVRRMQGRVEEAFDHAWRMAREHAKAASQARAARRESLLALTGAALRERIAALQALLGPELQVAHRNLDDLGEDDLRSLLADLEELTDGRSAPT